MIYYNESIKKAVKKGEIPTQIMRLFHNAFLSLDLTNDLNLFDIKKLKGNFNQQYFRMRKGKYRAIFYIEKKDFNIIYIGKREEAYDLWQ